MLSDVTDWAIGDVICFTEINKSTGLVTGRSTCFFIDNIIIWAKIGMISAKQQVHFKTPVPNIPLTFQLSNGVSVASNTINLTASVGNSAYGFGDVLLNSGLLNIELQYQSVAVNTYVGFQNQITPPYSLVRTAAVRQSNNTVYALLYDTTHVQIVSGVTRANWFRLQMNGSIVDMYKQLSNGSWVLVATANFPPGYPIIFYVFGLQINNQVKIRNFINVT